MRENVDVRRLIKDEWITIFQEEREGIRTRAREKIDKIQAQNRKSYNKKRKKATRYRQGDIVATKRIRTGPGFKLCPKFLTE